MSGAGLTLQRLQTGLSQVPLRRFGAYTIPDFAEGRFDSPTFRKIAVIFVLCIGFFYTMPQMKGAGVTMAPRRMQAR